MKNILLLVSLLLSVEVFSMEHSSTKSSQLPSFLYYAGTMQKPRELAYIDDPEKVFSEALFGDRESEIFQNLPVTDEVHQYLKGFRSDFSPRNKLDLLKNPDGFSIFDLILLENKSSLLNHFIQKRPFLEYASGKRTKWYRPQHSIADAINSMKVKTNILIAAKVNPYFLTMKDQSGRNLLQWAIDFGLIRFASKLIRENRELIFMKDHNGWTALDWAVVTGNDKIIQKIQTQVEPSEFKSLLARDLNGGTILHWRAMAIAAGYIKLCDPESDDVVYKNLPLFAGTIKDSAGESASTFFTWAKHYSCIATAKRPTDNVLHSAIKLGDAEGAERFIRYFPSLLNDSSWLPIEQGSHQSWWLTPLEMARKFVTDNRFHGFINTATRLVNSERLVSEKTPILTSLIKQTQSSDILDIDLDNLITKLDDDQLAMIVSAITGDSSDEKEQTRSPIVLMDVDEQPEEKTTTYRTPYREYIREAPARSVLPGKFAPDDCRKLKTPQPHEKRKRSFASTPTIFFEKVVVNNDDIQSMDIIVRDVGTDEMSGKYFSFHENFPNAQERLTVILAGRKKQAYIPKEQDGGRVVLILAGDDEMSLARSLVGPHVDVFVLTGLNYFNGKLENFELPLITSRRLAAFELVNVFPNRQTVAILDDNINAITMSDKIIERGFPTNWIGFYESLSDITKDYACIGFKEHRPDQRVAYENTDEELTIQTQGDQALEESFGQKIFFFNVASMTKASHGKMRNFFPPEIRLTQEDLHFQMYLAKANFKVGHVRPASMFFHRVKGKSLSAKNTDRCSRWLDLVPRAEMDPTSRNTFYDIQAYVAEILNMGRLTRQQQLATPLEVFLNPQDRFADPWMRTLANDIESDLTESSADPQDEFVNLASEIENSLFQQDNSSERPRKKRKIPSTSVADNFMYRFGELDRDPANFSDFAFRLQVEPMASFRPYQDEAIRSVGEHLARDQHLGFIKMPTGTGKTLLFSEIIHRANASINGNIALILPNLDIQNQVFDVMQKFAADVQLNRNKVVKHLGNIRPVSSQVIDVNSELAAFNQTLRSGGKLVLFCERSFSKFVEHRRGDLQDFSILIFDEMHKIQDAAASYIDKLQQNTHGLILGFSATPHKRKNLFGGGSKRIFHYSIETAVEENYLVDWETRLVSVPEQRQDFASALAKILSEEELGGEKLTVLQGIVYTSYDTKDTNDIAQQLQQRGIRAEAYNFNSPNRASILERFKNQETKVLVAIRTLREGFDGDVDYVMIHQPTATLEDIVQMRGRALRKIAKKPNKIALVLATDERVARLASATGDKISQVETTSTTTSKD